MAITITELATPTLLADLEADGISLSVQDSKLLARPSSKLTPELREHIAAAKPELVCWVLGLEVRAGRLPAAAFESALRQYETEHST